MNQVNLAVIMPCWNSEKYISELLDTIILQTFKNWTLLTIDDGSTDSTASIIKSYQAKDSRIQYYLRTMLPKGAQTCRNFGISLTEGYKYIMIIDSDDLLANYCFQQRVQFMETHSELDFAIFPAKKFIDYPWDNHNYIYGFKHTEDILNAMFYKTLPMVGWTNIYNRESYIKYGLTWDNNLTSMQDSDFNIQAILKGCKYAFAEEQLPDYFYRELPNSVSKRQHKKSHFISHAYLLNKTVNSLSEKQRHKYRKALNAYMVLFYYIASEKYSRNIFFKNPILKGRIWFQLRLLLLSRFHKRMRFIFFPIISIRTIIKWNKWQKAMMLKSIEYKQKLNSIINERI